MYLFSFRAYVYLSVSEFLLFTVFTPLYITLIYDLLVSALRWGYALSALLAVVGAAIIRYDKVSDHFWTRSDVCAAGEHQFRHWHGGLQTPDGNPSDAAA
jgi:drug/metabolite transporter (DMT)-like permease